jgi:hypothetical protein
MMSLRYPVIRVFWISAVLVEVSLDLQSCMRWTEKITKDLERTHNWIQRSGERMLPPRQNKNHEKDNLQVYHMLFLNLYVIHDINKHWICYVSPKQGHQKHCTCHENEYFVCMFQKPAYKSRWEKWLPPGCNLLPHKDQGEGSRLRACSMAYAWVQEVNLGRSMDIIVFCP